MLEKFVIRIKPADEALAGESKASNVFLGEADSRVRITGEDENDTARERLE